MDRLLLAVVLPAVLTVAVSPVGGQSRFGYGYDPLGYYRDLGRNFGPSQNSRYGFGIGRYGFGNSQFGQQNATRYGSQFSPFGQQFGSYGHQFNIYGGLAPKKWQPLSPDYNPFSARLPVPEPRVRGVPAPTAPRTAATRPAATQPTRVRHTLPAPASRPSRGG